MRAAARVALLGVLGFGLAACDTDGRPVQANEQSVTIRTTSVGPRAAIRRLAQTEADRVCGLQGKGAEYQSTTEVADRNKEDHFFLCI